ncbi:MAG TPA: LysR family transcriptional regulator [Hyphomicrobiaceae bacterium]|jgi:DNA-binding transcriptional LysR family regulator|nr:LysR family transcriptional regulator [Hyphomicrobiaceae bacterium]
MFEWDDVKYFLAVARHGSTLAAAKAMSLSQSTVQRRVTELERKLGRELVKRHATGYRLTEFGEEMLPYAEQIERAALAFEQRKAVIERGEGGVIRVTCPEPIVYRIMKSSLLDRFHEQHPKLRVEFVMSDRYVDLARGDADVALRSGDTDDDVLVGRKIADSIWSVYASKAYLERNGGLATIAELARHPTVGFDGPMASNRAAKWLQQVAPEAPIAARVTSVLGLVSVAKSGVAPVPMPIALGDAEPELVRLFEQVPELTRSWRILAHPDRRRTPAVAAFFTFIAAETASLRPILTG